MAIPTKKTATLDDRLSNIGVENVDFQSDLRDEGSNASDAYRLFGSKDGLNQYAGQSATGESNANNRQLIGVNGVPQAQSRGLQLAAANGYQSMMNGTGPSLANSVYNKGASVAMNAAANAGARGNAAGSRAAIMGAANNLQSANTQSVNQRVGEYNGAAGGLGGVVNNMSGQDMQYANANSDNMLDSRSQNDSLAFNYANNAERARALEMEAQMRRTNLRNGLTQSQLIYAEEQQARNNEEARALGNAMWGMAGSAAGAVSMGAANGAFDGNKK